MILELNDCDNNKAMVSLSLLSLRLKNLVLKIVGSEIKTEPSVLSKKIPRYPKIISKLILTID